MDSLPLEQRQALAVDFGKLYEMTIRLDESSSRAGGLTLIFGRAFLLFVDKFKSPPFKIIDIPSGHLHR